MTWGSASVSVFLPQRYQIRNTKLIFHLFLDMGTDCLLFSFILHQNSSSHVMATWCITNRNISRSTTKQNSNETHQLVAQIPELTHTKNMKLSWWCQQEVLPDCIRIKRRELNFLMPLTKSQRVHSKILQADILPGFTQGTCVPVPAKYNYCNRGKRQPQTMAVQEETAQIHPEGISFETWHFS